MWLFEALGLARPPTLLVQGWVWLVEASPESDEDVVSPLLHLLRFQQFPTANFLFPRDRFGVNVLLSGFSLAGVIITFQESIAVTCPLLRHVLEIVFVFWASWEDALYFLLHFWSCVLRF